MSGISRAALFGKLNPLGFRALDAATVLCKLRGNPYVELVHFLNQMLHLQDSDLHRILRDFEIDPSRLATDLTQALDRLPRGATSILALSPHLDAAVERGWLYATLLFGDAQVRIGHLMVGITKTPELRNVLLSISKEFEKVNADRLAERSPVIAKDSPESKMGASDGSKLGSVDPAPRRWCRHRWASPKSMIDSSHKPIFTSRKNRCH